MGEFEDRLWGDLLEAHGDQLAAAQRPARGRARPMALAVGGLGVVGVGTAVALTLTVSTSAPAYAVTRNPDGTVSVTIHDLTGVTGANAALAKLGVRARALTFGPDCTEVEHPDPHGASAYGSMIVRSPAQDEVTIQPRAIPVGDTLVLAAKVTDDGRVAVRVGLVLDPAPSCFKVGRPTLVTPTPGSR